MDIVKRLETLSYIPDEAIEEIKWLREEIDRKNKEIEELNKTIETLEEEVYLRTNDLTHVFVGMNHKE